MSKVRVAGFSVSLDGFSAGIEQNLGDPLGKRGTEIFQWYFHTKSFCSMHGREGGTRGDVDDVFAHRAMENFGAFILGRNMFGPMRGPWLDGSWKGWWAAVGTRVETQLYHTLVSAKGFDELKKARPGCDAPNSSWIPATQMFLQGPKRFAVTCASCVPSVGSSRPSVS